MTYRVSLKFSVLGAEVYHIIKKMVVVSLKLVLSTTQIRYYLSKVVINELPYLVSCYTNFVFSFRELAAIVDRSWRMEMGGVLREEPLPI